MLQYIVLSAILALIAGLNFVQTAKLAQSGNWTPGKTKFYFIFDTLFAILVAVAAIAVWTV